MADHAYFFVGNCQLQYLSAMVGAASPAERYFVGHRFNVNVALDGPWAPNLERDKFLQMARQTRAEGKRPILIVQETSRSYYLNRIRKKLDWFDDYIVFPHIHFGSLWPHRRMKTELSQMSDRHIRRVFDWEKFDFLEKLRRCNFDDPSGFAEDYWSRNCSQLRFFHPGHTSGSVFAEILEGMRGTIKDRLPCYEPLIAALRQSEGIYQNSTHPIPSRVPDLLPLEWARTEFYQSWLSLSEASGPAPLREAVARAESVLADPDLRGAVTWPFQSHLEAVVGAANQRLGRQDRGIAQMERATIALKGYGPLVRRTVNLAVRFRRADVIENTLVGVAPYVEVNGSHHPGYETCFAGILSLPQGRDLLGRIQEQTAADTWVHQYIRTAIAGAE